MDVFSPFQDTVLKAIAALKAEGVVPADAPTNAVTVEPPKEAGHGDLATNAALVLAKPARMAPRALAEKLIPLIAAHPDIASVEIAGPGFVNMTLAQSFWPGVVRTVLEQSQAFGRSQTGAGSRVNVEYVSANPTGPMHVGHCRGAVFGDALSNLLDFTGHEVVREYYVNDAGAQIDVLARSAYLRYREALGEDIGEIPEGLYPGAYLEPVGAALAEDYGDKLLMMSEAEWMPLVKRFSVDAMLALIRDDLAALDIRHDIFFSERSMVEGQDLIAETIRDLRTRDLIYEGRLPRPKGQTDEDWEDREQLLFRSTDFGDDLDRALLKSDGAPTYFSADIAYHREKFRRGFKTMIDVWGADHSGHVKRMQAALKALLDDEAALDIKLCQLVRLFRAGAAVKMSKRAGTFITLRDVVNEVGPGPVRFMMLYRKNDAPLDFDFAKVTEQSRDNPVFYVQYAHARACSVLRNVRDVFPELALEDEELAGAAIYLLDDEAELTVIRRLAYFPRIIEAAAAAHEPHRVAFYIHDLASDFHSLWNRGKDLPQLRFIHQGEPELTGARIALVAAVRRVLSLGLGILGVQPVEELH